MNYKKLSGKIDLVLFSVFVIVFLVIFSKTIDFTTQLLATGVGVFIAFYLNSEYNKALRRKIYKSLLKGLVLEFKSNIRIIKDDKNNKKGVGISFETFKFTVSNEIFTEHFLREKEAGEKMLEELWDIITILRRVKEEQEIKKFKEENIAGFNKYQAILKRLEELYSSL